MGEGSLVARMKEHFSQTHCSEDSASSNLSSSSKQMSMESFVISTTSAEKKLFDKSIAKFIYGSNIQFRAADSKEFKNMVNNLRPGYKPPNSKAIGGVLLDEVYNELKCGAKDILNGCMVSLCVDGWSNVSSDSVVGMSVQHKDKVFLVRSVDASGNKNTGEFLRDITKEVIVDVQTEYQCKIVSIVTNNAENMKKNALS